jgi:hypothetical protein
MDYQWVGFGCRCLYADTAVSRLEDINKSCLEQFRTHWQCLENNNQQLWQCRPDEWKLNKCVFEKLVRRPPLFLLLACANRVLLFGRIWRRSSPTNPSNRRPYTSDKGRCLPINGSSGGRSRLCRNNLRHQSPRPELAGWWFFWHTKCVSSRSPEIPTGGWFWAQTCTYIPRVREAHPATSCEIPCFWTFELCRRISLFVGAFGRGTSLGLR